MRIITLTLLTAFAVACTTPSHEKLQPFEGLSALAPGELQVELLAPEADVLSTGDSVVYDIEGMASAIGGVRHIDIMLVMDQSTSLKKTDPSDYRSAGAIGFVEHLSPKSDTKIGVVGFDSDSALLQGLTADRDAVVATIDGMARFGGTNIAAGVLTALEELQANGRDDSSRMIMLFTDGKSNQKKAREATRQALAQGVTVHTLLLGDSKGGAEILDEIAQGTGGSFIQVTDPAMLPEAFLNLRTTGVEQVTLSVDGAPSVPAQLTGGTFQAQLPLSLGNNRIVARATSLDDQVRETAINVRVRDASCAALDVDAMANGLPAMSLNERAVQIIIDASRSMWGRMDGEPKMSVAQETLLDAADWLPRDLDLALRAYGNTSHSEANNCEDTQLLVPFGSGSRDDIRTALGALKPKGQTPIAFALEQAAEDLSGLTSERTMVLVTDGIESCGGDPIATAEALRADGNTIHVIGFGLGNAADEDTASLQAIASAGGGQYFPAGNAAELKSALQSTVGTPFRVLRGDDVVASSVLGADEQFFLPRGEYRVELDSLPPQAVEVSLAPRDALTLTMKKDDGAFSHAEQRAQLSPVACEEAVANNRNKAAKERPAFTAVEDASPRAGQDATDYGWWHR